MPITDNQSLQAAVIKWMARDDITPDVQDCVQLAETYFNRRLRVRQMENVITLLPLSPPLFVARIVGMNVPNAVGVPVT